MGYDLRFDTSTLAFLILFMRSRLTHFLFFPVFMRTGDGPLHLLSTDYLVAFRERGICQFHPETAPDLPSKRPLNAKRIRGKVHTHLQPPRELPFWPVTDDFCSTALSNGPGGFTGLGFKMTTPDC